MPSRFLFGDPSSRCFGFAVCLERMLQYLHTPLASPVHAFHQINSLFSRTFYPA